jgi:hypothetical protein
MDAPCYLKPRSIRAYPAGLILQGLSCRAYPAGLILQGLSCRAYPYYSRIHWKQFISQKILALCMGRVNKINPISVKIQLEHFALL